MFFRIPRCLCSGEVHYHKRYLVSTVMDEGGEVLRKDRVKTDRRSIEHYFREISKGDRAKAVMEACRNWAYLYDKIEPIVGKVVLAHPYKTRAIAEARIKTDSIDSEILSHLLRADLIAEAYAPSSETRQVKDILRYRAALKQMSTSMKNRVHLILDRNEIEGEDLKGLSDKFGKRGREIMKQLELRGRDGEIVKDYLEFLELIEEKIKKIDGWIKETGSEDKVVQLLKTIPGIGEFTALLLLRVYYMKVRRRVGANGAILALARKLLEIVYKVWKEERAYYSKPVAVAL